MAKQGQEPAETTAAATEPQPERALVEKLRGRGFEIEADNDDSLLESFEQLLTDKESAPSKEDYDRLKKLEPYATEYTQYASEFQQWKAERAKQAEAVKEDSPKPPSPPKIDPASAQVVHAGLGTGQVTRTAAGIYEAKDPSFAPFVQQVNLATAQRREFFQRFEDDPAGFIADYAKPQIAAIEKSYKDELSAVKDEMKNLRKRDSDTSIEKFFERNYKEFWSTDEEGSIQQDTNGRGVLNARGLLYSKMMAELAEEIPDEAKRHEKAVAFSRQVPVESAEAEPKDRKRRFLERTSKKPGRTTDRLVEQGSAAKADAAVTAGKKRGKMDWNELMRVTQASFT